MQQTKQRNENCNMFSIMIKGSEINLMSNAQKMPYHFRTQTCLPFLIIRGQTRTVIVNIKIVNRKYNTPLR